MKQGGRDVQLKICTPKEAIFVRSPLDLKLYAFKCLPDDYYTEGAGATAS